MFAPLPKKGFSLVETVIAVAIFSMVSVALFSSYKRVHEVIRRAEVRAEMAALSVEQFEIIKNLPYESIGTISGIPSGVIPQVKHITKGNSEYTVYTTIRNIDLPYDGLIPADTAPEDNKLAQLEIVCETCRDLITSNYNAQFGPKNLEGATGNGSLFVRTIDSKGNPVSGADVRIKVDAPNPVVDINDTTNTNGVLQIIGAAPLKNAYQVYVSKPGYTSDQTYSASGPTTTRPVIPYATVDPGVVTQITFIIDKVSTLNVLSISPLCTPIGDVDFRLTGSKMIGYEPVYKYSKDLVTDAAGSLIVNNLEWDTYNVSVTDSIYSLIGIIPAPQFSISPDTTQSVQLVLMPTVNSGQNQNTITISVKDSQTGAQVSGANVKFEHSQQIENTVTGRGQMIQTDWSNGGGQLLYVDTKAYHNDDGNVDTTTVPGSVMLRKSGTTYVPNGIMTSSIIDTGLSSNFSEFHFSPIIQASGTEVKFQLATANATSGPFNYIGPDGTAGTYYTKDSSIINAIHNGMRYIRYRVYLSTTDDTKTPSVEDITFYYTSACMAPGQAYVQSIHNGGWDITISKAGYQTIEDHVTVGGSEPWISKMYSLDPE